MSTHDLLCDPARAGWPCRCCTDEVRVAIVGCSAEKATEPAPPGLLYLGRCFRASIALGRVACDAVAVASARHGALLDLDRPILEPYDERLSDLPGSGVEAWARRVVVAVLRRHAPVPGELRAVILAGAEYALPLASALGLAGCLEPILPLAGLSSGPRYAALVRMIEAGAGGVPFDLRAFSSALERELRPPAPAQDEGHGIRRARR